MKLTSSIISITGIAFSFFYGLKATEIFLKSEDYKSKKWPWKFHQFWLNFIGSLTGWISLLVIYPRIFDCIQNNQVYSIRLADILLFFLSFIGITGYLPMTIVGVIQGLKDIFAKVLGLLNLPK
jgi:cbb3-type cytochrome oxidase subunit 1